MEFPFLFSVSNFWNLYCSQDHSVLLFKRQPIYWNHFISSESEHLLEALP